MLPLYQVKKSSNDNTPIKSIMVTSRLSPCSSASPQQIGVKFLTRNITNSNN